MTYDDDDDDATQRSETSTQNSDAGESPKIKDTKRAVLQPVLRPTQPAMQYVLVIK
jgi:hypothetical protein